KGFYFGGDEHPGLRTIVDNLGEIDARELNATPITDVATLRFGKYGPYLEVIDPEKPDADPRRINVPEELAPDELTPAKVQELIDAPVAGNRVLGENPDNGKIVVVKDGRFGPYLEETDPEPEQPEADPATGEVVETPKKKTTKKAAAPKPRRASLFKSMSPETIELETALKLLNLPRTVGIDPTSEEPITAQNGRYGPYLKRGTDSRSLEAEQQIFDITLDEALEVYAKPKYGARRAASALKEFEKEDPASGKAVRIRDGRFGPYVTDGETNATIPRGTNVDDVDFEAAVQLLADKRAKGPAKKRTTTRKAPAKKPAAKKTTATKKAPAKKPAAKKTGNPSSTTKKATPKSTDEA
ncbi:MAG: topoisomerase C-terminal repeat-containing protein, partial [Candidatus Microbacterium stercoravium]